MYSYICPVCGAYLDPGETCDCKAEREDRARRNNETFAAIEDLLEEESNGQLRIAV
jgi:hypothetical protein